MAVFRPTAQERGEKIVYFYQRYYIDENICFNGDIIRSIEGFYITIDEEKGVARLEVEGSKDSNSNAYSGTGLLYVEEIPLSGSGKFAARYADGEPVNISDSEDLGDPI